MNPVAATKLILEDAFDSSAIDSIKYDTDTKRLEVVFKSGAKYAYDDVPRYTVTMLRNSKSKGLFFHSYIRPKYEFERLTKGGPGSGYHGPRPPDDDDEWGGSAPRHANRPGFRNKNNPEVAKGHRNPRTGEIERPHRGDIPYSEKPAIGKPDYARERMKWFPENIRRINKNPEQREWLVKFLRNQDKAARLVASRAPSPQRRDTYGDWANRAYQSIDAADLIPREDVEIEKRLYSSVMDDLDNDDMDMVFAMNDNISEYWLRKRYRDFQLSGDAGRKGKECDKCGGKTVGFLGDAFLCQKCMDKATYPIKWHAKDGNSKVKEWGERVKRFHLQRDVDESGVSGTGHVAEGVELYNGVVVMWWVAGNTPSVTTYANIGDCLKIHGHGDATKLVWEDL